MLNCEEPTLFVIVGDTPSGTLAVPTTSARAAAQAARHLTEHCPHTHATWQVSSHIGPCPVMVFGCVRPPIGKDLLDQDAHAFPLSPGEALPSVWVALCGHQIRHAEFEALDQDMVGRPCRDCHQWWATPHHQHTGLPVRSPGEHLHPQLRRPHGGNAISRRSRRLTS